MIMIRVVTMHRDTWAGDRVTTIDFNKDTNSHGRMTVGIQGPDSSSLDSTIIVQSQIQ